MSPRRPLFEIVQRLAVVGRDIRDLSSRALRETAHELREFHELVEHTDTNLTRLFRRAESESAADRVADAEVPVTSEFLEAPRLYHGARLNHCAEIFPKAFAEKPLSGITGHIRPASHGHEGTVYLADEDLAHVYGMIPRGTDAFDPKRRFHPVGVVLGIDTRTINVRRMTRQRNTAMEFVPGVTDRVGTTDARLDTSCVVSARFEVYDVIVNDPEVSLVTDGIPFFEDLDHEAVRSVTAVTDRLSAVADAVRRNYPEIDVTVDTNHTPAHRAIEIYRTTVASSLLYLSTSAMAGLAYQNIPSDDRLYRDDR
ncbi:MULTISPECIES: hypothetical protein [Nocardia]|uniref:hypothetical protein n=1 Tax=Nocardia TaxID=1817 RepID=UPI00135AE9E3|nr:MULTISPECIES: hypothetical protein [Nocardia]